MQLQRMFPLEPIFDPDKQTGAVVVENTPGTPPSVSPSMSVVGSVDDGDINISDPQRSAVSGNYLFVSDAGSWSVNVIDITTPASLTLDNSLFHATDLRSILSAHIDGTLFFTAAFGPAAATDRFAVVDIATPTAPSIAGSVTAASIDGALGGSTAVIGTHAFITIPNLNRIAVIDISTPSTPSIVTTLTHATDLKDPRRLAAVGSSHLYVPCPAVVSGTPGVTVVDVSTPGSPSIVSFLTDATHLQGPTEIVTAGSLALVADSESNRLTVLDASTPAAPTVLGSVSDATNLDHFGFISAYGTDYVIGVSGVGGSGRFLTAVDVSVPSAPSIVATLADAAFLDFIEGTSISGDHLYASAYAGSTARITAVLLSDFP